LRKRGKLSRRARWKGEKKVSRKSEYIYVCTEEETRGGKERKLASQIENRRQPERIRVVIIRAPVKTSPFIPESFTFRIPHLSLSLSCALPLYFQDLSRPEKYSLCTLRNIPKLFEDAGKKPAVPIAGICCRRSLRSNSKKRKYGKRSSYSLRASNSITPFSTKKRRLVTNP